ncbi:MAG: hypothetical protein C5B54_05280 [Acidobacteria bacterium]|nr:MAG: hypothetical protein C5B54_05280 [Acidobacteriota bacterium]
MQVGEITKDWLRSVLNWPITDADEITVAPLSLSNGAMGGVYRVRCADRAFVFKCPPSADSPWYRVCSEMGLLDREIEIYRFFGVGERRKIAPECYWSRLMSEGSSALALQDLCQAGRVMDRFVRGLNRNEAVAALRTLATLHGVLPTIDGDARASPLPWLGPASSDGLAAAITEGLSVVPSLVETMFPDNFPREHFSRIRQIDIPRVVARSHCGSKLLSLCHGDCWSSNVLFTSRLGCDGMGAMLVDWQFAMWGNPLSDVALLLLSSLSPAGRRAWVDDLLTCYHLQLTKDVAGYSLDDCYHDFSKAMPFAALVATATLDAYTCGLTKPELRHIAMRMEAIIDEIPELFVVS